MVRCCRRSLKEMRREESGRELTIPCVNDYKSEVRLEMSIPGTLSLLIRSILIRTMYANSPLSCSSDMLSHVDAQE